MPNNSTIYDSVVVVVTTACDIDGPLQGASATVSNSQGVQSVILADGLEADCENGYAFLSQIPLKQGTNTFQVWLYDQAWNPVNGTLVIYADYVIPPVHVEPERALVPSNPGATLYEKFLVANPRDDSLRFRFTASCSGAATCVSTPDSVTLLHDQWTEVVVGYSVSGTTKDTGRVYLRATQTTDTTNTSVSSFKAVVGPTGAVVDRSSCVSVALGASAAAECGDLRLTHALPSVRTLNQLRTPMLSYVSGHASPRPILTIDATLPGGSGTPDSVVTTVTIDGQPHRRAVAGSQFMPAGTARRAMLLLDSLSLATGLHPYAIAVWRYTGSDSSLLASDSAETIIVNRSQSPFGAGWWLNGVEQLYAVSDARVLWVGGDGSARVYEPMGTSGAHTVYLAPQLTGSDTLLKVNATGAFIRRLRGGGAVHFDAQLRHSSTVNRLGHTTTLAYDGKGRLWKLTVPPSAAALAYELSYADTSAGARVTSVSVADSAVGVLRITTLSIDGSSRLVGITDPDSTTVSFAYLDSLARFIKSRTDRRGYTTNFEYDAGRRVSRGRLPFAGDSTFTAICAAESQGMTACAPTAPSPFDVRTVINGLRTDVVDTAAFWVGPYGVWKARNARGTTTLISREDARFPALVTRLRGNDGRVVAAEYNYNANVVAIVDSSHFVVAGGNTTYAKTRYTWHLGLNLPTGIYRPEGAYTQMAYNSNGTLLWQQDARGTASRTNYRYTSSGQLRAIVHPGGAKDSLEFDGTRENVSRTISPLGRTTRYVTDRVGRVTESHVLIHLDSALEQSAYTAYDRNGRVVRQVADGPAHNATARQRVFVSHRYDDEGNLLWTKRWQLPSPTGIDTLTTSWAYDPVGRLLAEAAPDGFRDSTVYNAAGLPIRHITRRGDTIRTTYDELGNVVKRVERSRVDTAFRLGAARINDSLPENPPYGNYAIPLDSALFTYDAEGRMLTASNRDAVVKRSYTPHGAIETDSLFIAYWDYSATHAYGLQYHYDLDGRMVRLDYPSQLVQGTSGRVEYAYDDTTGLLRSITGLQDEVFSYSYNARNELVQLSKPGDIVELHTFDADGFLTQRRVRNLTAPSLPDRYPAEWIEQTDMTYDARGKLLSAMNAYGLETQRLFLYTGLGHLESQEVAVTGTNSVGSAVWLLAGEEYRLDPMGNFDSAYELLDAASRTVLDQRHRSFTKLRSPDSFFYEAGTGRLHWMASNSGENRVTLQEHRYDRAGNLTWTGADNFLATLPTDSIYQPRIWEDRVAYYDAAGRVRHAEKRRWHREYPYNPDINATLTRQRETYRYDALGRRVLVRSHNDCQNLNVSAMPHCDISSVVRTVWAGDQELVEVARPASGMPIAAPNDTATDAMMESDTDSLMLAMRLDGQGFGGKTYIGDLDPNRLFGRVAYVHGPGIDRPVSLTRLGYEARDRAGTGMPWKRWAPFTIVPLWSLRGIAEGGTFPSGAVRHRLEVPEDEYSEEIFVAWKIDGPSHAQPVYGTVVPWFGTLITNKYDGVGTMYRRNRHYDPTTGRFTQPDPIGLAGGLNLYGYANGDPINGSDPFGLKVCFQGSRSEVRRLAGDTRWLTNTKFELDADNCATGVTPRGRSFTEEGRGFNEMASDENRTYNVSFGSGGSRRQATSVVVDRSDIGKPYGVNFVSPGHCTGPNNARWDRASILAHELGEMYGAILEYDGFPGSAVAVSWENSVHSRRGRPLREQRCHSHP